MFRRTKSPEPAQPTVVKEGGKGRPTPSRREAEAARKARAKAGMDKKAAKQLLRERRAAENAKMRQGLKTGDERYLPPRDQGPVRRFVRDFVDARVSMAEMSSSAQPAPMDSPRSIIDITPGMRRRNKQRRE